MPDFDLRTVVFLTGAMGALMAMVLHFLRRSYPHSIQGMSDWSLGPLVIGASTLFIGMQSHLPDLITKGVANFVMLSGGYLLVRGTHRHVGQTTPRWPLYLLWLVALPAMLWTSSISPSYEQRLFVLSGILASYFVSMLWVLLRKGKRSFATSYTGVVLTALSIVMALRMATATSVPAGSGLFDATFFQSLYILSLSFGLLMLSIGFVLLASEQLRQELENIITHDLLTGALARRALLAQGQTELARAQRSGNPTSVLMLDLDHFKLVNDNHGHLVGDAVLRDFAQRCMSHLRPSDLFCRWGGEEFVVLLPETAPPAALSIAERLRQSQTADATLPACTVSIGLASLTPQEEQSLDTLISRADAALYQAKARGRNRVEIATPAGQAPPAPPAQTTPPSIRNESSAHPAA